jgi:hypothetical protein
MTYGNAVASLINGTHGFVYGLTALGLTLISGVMKVINFAMVLSDGGNVRLLLVCHIDGIDPYLALIGGSFLFRVWVSYPGQSHFAGL